MSHLWAALLLISPLVAQDDPRPGRLRLPSSRKLETLLNTRDRAVVWRATEFGSIETEAHRSDGSKIRGEMTLSLIWARYADGDKFDVKGVRMVFEAKDKGAVVASRVSVVDAEELEKIIGVLGMIEAMAKDPKGDNLDYHMAGGVTLRGVMMGSQPVFQACATPEAGRVGPGEFVHEPPGVAAQLKDILKGAQAKLKE
jgi:hypothetical protein